MEDDGEEDEVEEMEEKKNPSGPSVIKTILIVTTMVAFWLGVLRLIRTIIPGAP